MFEKEEHQCECRSRSQVLAMPAPQLAEVLGISVRQVWRLNGAGKLPRPNHLGGCVRWNRQEIEQWFVAGCPDRRTWEAGRVVQG